ncbi:MAG: pyridoxamine 5'-phosphate oxidase family protein [Clostridiales Family XIII bacterium]|nr:pyridoxamine 5'-phosphate oxidase family protein [Clostridiales Family XIII bacterium]
MNEVYDFLKKAEVYYLATAEGDQPRVRPFGTYIIYEDKLYIQTGKVKDISRQIAANPKIEICAFSEGQWLRIAATAVDDDRIETKQYILDQYPNLKDRYSADDGNTQALWLKDAAATFESFSGEKKTVTF